MSKSNISVSSYSLCEIDESHKVSIYFASGILFKDKVKIYFSEKIIFMKINNIFQKVKLRSRVIRFKNMMKGVFQNQSNRLFFHHFLCILHELIISIGFESNI